MDRITAFWLIVSGQGFFLLSAVFYIIAWILNYGKESFMPGPGQKVLVGTSVLYGLVASTLSIMGVAELAVAAERLSVPIWQMAAAGASVFIAVMLISVIFMHRPFTTELLLLSFWTTLELIIFFTISYTWGKMGPVAQWGYLIAVMIFIIGTVCYLLHFRLRAASRFVNGLISYTVIALYTVWAGISMVVFLKSLKV